MGPLPQYMITMKSSIGHIQLKLIIKIYQCDQMHKMKRRDD